MNIIAKTFAVAAFTGLSLVGCKHVETNYETTPAPVVTKTESSATRTESNSSTAQDSVVAPSNSSSYERHAQTSKSTTVETTP